VLIPRECPRNEETAGRAASKSGVVKRREARLTPEVGGGWLRTGNEIRAVAGLRLGKTTPESKSEVGAYCSRQSREHKREREKS